MIPIFINFSLIHPNNYKPISTLTIFSKLLEKLFYNRLDSFILKHNIPHSNQFSLAKINLFP